MEDKKIIKEVWNDKKEMVLVIEDEKTVVKDLLADLWNKKVINIKGTKMKYNDNFTNLQKITFIYQNGWRSVYKNIPTSWGTLDTSKLLQEAE